MRSSFVNSNKRPWSDENYNPNPNELPDLPVANYHCRWVKCNSALHNLATLRGHIFTRHLSELSRSEKPGLECWWKRCEFIAVGADNILSSTHVFPNEKDWKQHIEVKHIQPIGRKYGDGPCTNTDHQNATRAKRRFLSDAKGHEATPFIPHDISDNSNDLPHDALELMRHYPEGQMSASREADEEARQGFFEAHGAQSSDQRHLAEETIRAMISQKRKIGPGIDRGGCTLINEARRATFVQAPGILRLIDADDS